CAVEGRAHARLVRSIARDKEATAESAEAACEEALARQASGANDLGTPNPNRREGNAAGPHTTNTNNPSKGGTSKDGTSGGDSGSESDRTPQAEPPSEPPSEPTASPPPPAEDTQPGNGDENGNAGGNGNGNGGGNSGGNGNGNGGGVAP
ncbi:MAG TPA: hypothetical protein VHJ82_00005, partial [Actinomycetota bacterium]|nr:hypothetical protein [Actinomycetota bacterium]